ncbi:hypothetical protein AMEX_G24980 [Astyanax mexicanus]|uniref:Uncharacterized protein n=1 Tax=Astyanax mexicanus TaxID=7994 RepID=A0A8T2KU88_ASTMX|nr:hypothetical protein AMEX_G24980 [Astyanax mexicanus]
MQVIKIQVVKIQVKKIQVEKFQGNIRGTQNDQSSAELIELTAANHNTALKPVGAASFFTCGEAPWQLLGEHSSYSHLSDVCRLWGNHSTSCVGSCFAS